MLRYFSPARTVLLGLCAAMFVLSSCEEVVDLGFEVPKSRLVINANFVPGAPVSLRVSATRPPGAPAVDITAAQVMLFEGQELAEELTYFPKRDAGGIGEYRTRHFQPRAGKQYTIHVAAVGYDPVTAMSSIPPPATIESLSIEGLSLNERGDFTIYDYQLAIDYDDPEEETNYYDLRISQKIIPFTVNQRGDTVRGPAYLKSIGTSGGRVDTDGTLSVLLRDRGGNREVRLHLQSQLMTNKELLGGLVAELRTVSPEYYFYHLSRTGQTVGGGTNGGLREPIILYNNVESGLGIFAGYNTVMQQVTFFMN